MDFFCGDVRVLFGGSAPKSRDGKVVESGLFPHLESFTERIDKHLHYTLPPNLLYVVTLEIINKSTSHRFLDFCLFEG